MKNHIKYIDGLKGLSAIWVTLAHYVLAFIPIGYIGWGSGIVDSDKKATYIDNLPFSIFTNSSFPLYTFFALIAFITTLAFFNKGGGKFLAKQAVKRYFRLMFPTLWCTMICYILLASGLMFNGELGKLASSHWSSVFYQDGYSIVEACKSAYYTAFIYGDGYYCSILWCMNVIFIGSYMTYAVLAIFGKSRYRWMIYAIIFLLCVKVRGDYTAFVVGIVSADVIGMLEKSPISNKLAMILIVIGLFVGNFVPTFCLPKWLHISVIYSIGNFFFLIGISQCIQAKRFFEGDILRKVGKYSFPLILIHFPIMMSFSAWVFVELQGLDFNFATSTIISWILSVPILIISTRLFYLLAELPTESLANKIWQKIIS